MSLPSNWNGKVEDRQHLGPSLLDEQVTDYGWSDSGVAGLPDTHNGPHRKE